MSVTPGGSQTLFPNRYHPLYATAAILLFVLVTGILDFVGVPGYLTAFGTLTTFIFVCTVVAIANRTMRLTDFYVGGQQSNHRAAGIAGAAIWISGAVYFSFVGLLFNIGYDSLAFVIGGSAGIMLLSILLMPCLRKFGGYTIGDFFAFRYDESARTVAAVLSLLFAIPLVIAHLSFLADALRIIVPLSHLMAVVVIASILIICSVFGGMKSASATQVFQALLCAAALSLPVAWMGNELGWWDQLPSRLIARLTDLSILEAVAASNGTALNMGRFIDPGSQYDINSFVAIVLVTAAGVAALPHLLLRFATTISPSHAQRAVGRSLSLIAIAVPLLAIYAIYTKTEILSSFVGESLGSVQMQLHWALTESNGLLMPLVEICQQPAQDFVSSLLACGGPDHVLNQSDLALDDRFIMVLAALLAGTPYPVVVFVVFGGIAALFCATSALVLMISNSVSHDIIYRSWDRQAPASRRLIIARMMVCLVTALAAWAAFREPLDLGPVLVVVLNLSAASLFPALLFGVWWRRTSVNAASWGMLIGFSTTALYSILLLAYNVPPVVIPGLMDNGITVPAAGIIGLTLNVSIILIGSILAGPPSDAIKDRIELLRAPSDGPLYDGRG